MNYSIKEWNCINEMCKGFNPALDKAILDLLETDNKYKMFIHDVLDLIHQSNIATVDQIELTEKIKLLGVIS